MENVGLLINLNVLFEEGPGGIFSRQLSVRHNTMKLSFFLGLTGVCLALNLHAQQPPTPLPEKPDADGWLRPFDGKTLSGWKSYDGKGWAMEDGVITGTGGVSHLFSPNYYTNVEFKAEVKLNHSGNSGMYFRTRFGPGFPRGYEAQVENTSPDPQRTGSLYNFHPVREQLIQDDTWWTQHIIAIGNRIIIKVNDKIVTDYVDTRNTFKWGHLAFQQHNDGSIVNYRKVMIKRLPADADEAWAIAKKDMPDVGDAPPAK
jgi:hypothetical protein